MEESRNMETNVKEDQENHLWTLRQWGKPGTNDEANEGEEY